MWQFGGPDDDRLERIAWRVGQVIERTGFLAAAALFASILWQLLVRR